MVRAAKSSARIFSGKCAKGISEEVQTASTDLLFCCSCNLMAVPFRSSLLFLICGFFRGIKSEIEMHIK